MSKTTRKRALGRASAVGAHFEAARANKHTHCIREQALFATLTRHSEDLRLLVPNQRILRLSILQQWHFQSHKPTLGSL